MTFLLFKKFPKEETMGDIYQNLGQLEIPTCKNKTQGDRRAFLISHDRFPFVLS